MDPDHVFLTLIDRAYWLEISKVEVFVDAPHRFHLAIVELRVQIHKVMENRAQDGLMELQIWQD